MKSLLSIAFIIALSFHMYGKKVPGGIVTNGTTREVTFDITGDFEHMQRGVKYFDEEGKKQSLSPNDADEIWFNLDGEKVRMFSNTVSGVLRSVKLFIKLEVDGPLKLFRLYDRNYNSTSRSGRRETEISVGSYFIYQKGGYTIDEPTVLFRKVDMLDYFSDCPALRERIEKSHLTDKDVKGFVTYYNENCAGK
jgi:hypothetical protein